MMWGTVQPQEGWAFEMMRGASPTFSKGKSIPQPSPSSFVPKSTPFLSKTTRGAARGGPVGAGEVGIPPATLARLSASAFAFARAAAVAGSSSALAGGAVGAGFAAAEGGGAGGRSGDTFGFAEALVAAGVVPDLAPEPGASLPPQARTGRRARTKRARFIGRFLRKRPSGEGRPPGSGGGETVRGGLYTAGGPARRARGHLRSVRGGPRFGRGPAPMSGEARLSSAPSLPPEFPRDRPFLPPGPRSPPPPPPRGMLPRPGGGRAVPPLPLLREPARHLRDPARRAPGRRPRPGVPLLLPGVPGGERTPGRRHLARRARPRAAGAPRDPLGRPRPPRGDPTLGAGPVHGERLGPRAAVPPRVRPRGVLRDPPPRRDPDRRVPRRPPGRAPLARGGTPPRRPPGLRPPRPPPRNHRARARRRGVEDPRRRARPLRTSEPMKPRTVYFFGNGRADGDRAMRELLGGKGANLAEMTNLGLPVPAGLTITTEVCHLFLS